MNHGLWEYITNYRLSRSYIVYRNVIHVADASELTHSRFHQLPEPSKLNIITLLIAVCYFTGIRQLTHNLVCCTSVTSVSCTLMNSNQCVGLQHLRLLAPLVHNRGIIIQQMVWDGFVIFQSGDECIMIFEAFFVSVNIRHELIWRHHYVERSSHGCRHRRAMPKRYVTTDMVLHLRRWLVTAIVLNKTHVVCTCN